MRPVNLEKRRRAIEEEMRGLAEFLAPFRPIWAYEVLNFYPDCVPHFKEEWFETLSSLKEEQELALENGHAPIDWPDSDLRNLFLKMSELEGLPHLKATEPEAYPSWALNKVSGKKQHEIKKIVSLLPTLGLKAGDHVVDIGGGKGHLPRILCLYHGLNGTTLDTNKEFQELGLKRYQKYPKPEGAGELEFINHTFAGEENAETEEFVFKRAKASFGLHTCGPLALHHLNRATSHQALLNFGCCYQKLDPEKEARLSRYANDNDLYQFSQHALTLASRGHTTISLKDYRIKKIVKLRRSALHFYLIDQNYESEFVTVGSAHPRDYQGPFSHYAHLKLKKLGLAHSSEEELKAKLDDFYQQEDLQEKLTWIYQANMIRWRFGRLLEKLLLLDRTLSLIEKGLDAYCFEIFEAKQSPRNIGIIVNPASPLE